MKKIITTLFAISFCIMAIAQTKKADRLFNNWEYFQAAALYEKEVASNPSPDIYYKLGQCYQKMNKYSDALRCYNKVNEAGPYTDAQFYIKYGQILKNTNLIKQLSGISELESIDITFVTNDPNNSGAIVTTKYYEIVRPNSITVNYNFQ